MLAVRDEAFGKDQLFIKKKDEKDPEVAKNEDRTGVELLWDHINKFSLEKSGKTQEFGTDPDGKKITPRKYELYLEAAKASAFYPQSAKPNEDGGVGSNPMGSPRFEKVPGKKTEKVISGTVYQTEDEAIAAGNAEVIKLVKTRDDIYDKMRLTKTVEENEELNGRLNAVEREIQDLLADEAEPEIQTEIQEAGNVEAQKGYPAGFQSEKGTNYAALIASRLSILNSMKPLSDNPSPTEILALKMANGRSLELLGDPSETERDFNKAMYIALLEEEGINQSGMITDEDLVEQADYAEGEEYERSALEKISMGTPVVAAMAGIPSVSKRKQIQEKALDADAQSAVTDRSATGKKDNR